MISRQLYDVLWREILLIKKRLAAVVISGGVVPAAHATTHEASGTDELDVTDLGGFPGGTTTFLRADGSFATPTAVAAGLERKVLGSNQTYNLQATPQNISDLSFSIGANETWLALVWLYYDGGTTGDLRFTWSLPSGGDGTHGAVRMQTGGTVIGNETASWVAGSISGGSRTAGAVGTGSTMGLLYYATLVNGSTGGTATVQASQSVSNGTTTTVFANSALVAFKL